MACINSYLETIPCTAEENQAYRKFADWFKAQIPLDGLMRISDPWVERVTPRWTSVGVNLCWEAELTVLVDESAFHRVVMAKYRKLEEKGFTANYHCSIKGPFDWVEQVHRPDWIEITVWKRLYDNELEELIK